MLTKTLCKRVSVSPCGRLLSVFILRGLDVAWMCLHGNALHAVHTHTLLTEEVHSFFKHNTYIKTLCIAGKLKPAFVQVPCDSGVTTVLATDIRFFGSFHILCRDKQLYIRQALCPQGFMYARSYICRSAGRATAKALVNTCGLGFVHLAHEPR